MFPISPTFSLVWWIVHKVHPNADCNLRLQNVDTAQFALTAGETVKKRKRMSAEKQHSTKSGDAVGPSGRFG